MSSSLDKVTIKGFKSIESLEENEWLNKIEATMEAVAGDENEA
jgi:hypothetical protein